MGACSMAVAFCVAFDQKISWKGCVDDGMTGAFDVPFAKQYERYVCSR